MARRYGSADKLTRRSAAALVRAVRAGRTLTAAAAAAGVSESTLRSWARKGRADTSGPYHSLALALDRARLTFERHLAGDHFAPTTVNGAATGDTAGIHPLGASTSPAFATPSSERAREALATIAYLVGAGDIETAEAEQ